MTARDTFPLAPRTHGEFAFSESHGVLHFHRAAEGERGKSRLSLLERGESIVLAIGEELGPSTMAASRDLIALSFTDSLGKPETIVVGRVADGANGLALSESIRIGRGAWQMSFDDGGERIACTNGSRGLWTYDVRTGATLGFLRTASFLCASSLAPDGRSLVALGTDGKLYAWRLGTDTPHAEIALEGLGESLRGSPDGALLAVRTAKEIVLVRRDPFSIVWRTPPVRPGAHGSSPNAGIGWVDDEQFLVPFEESAPEGPYVCRTEAFFYLFSRSAPGVRARVRGPSWGKLVTDPARHAILVTDESTARIHTLDSLLHGGQR